MDKKLTALQFSLLSELTKEGKEDIATQFEFLAICLADTKTLVAYLTDKKALDPFRVVAGDMSLEEVQETSLFFVDQCKAIVKTSDESLEK